MYKVDYTGRRFGRLVCLEKFAKDNRTYYKCKCDCGNSKIISYSNLFSGCTKSCGCLKSESLHRRKMPNDVIDFNGTFRYYKRNAKVRGFEFNLSKERFKELIYSKCNYCGRRAQEFSNGRIGIDRVDSNLGYEEGNIVPCCRICNQSKNDRTIEEFKAWVKLVYNRLENF